MATPIPPVPPQLHSPSGNFSALLYAYLVKLVAALVGLYGNPWNYRSVTHANSPVTAAPGDWIDCDTSGGSIIVTGPATTNGAWGVSKRSADVNTVSYSASAGNINGLPTQTIALQWGAVTLLGTGSGARITSTS